MIKLFFPSQKVPEWIETVRPKLGYENDCKLSQPIFKSIILAWTWKGSTMLYNLIPFTLFMYCDAENAIIDGSGGKEGRTTHFIFNHIEQLRYLPARLKYKLSKVKAGS